MTNEESILWAILAILIIPNFIKTIYIMTEYHTRDYRKRRRHDKRQQRLIDESKKRLGLGKWSKK